MLLAAPGLARADDVATQVVVRFDEAVPRFQQDAALAGAGLVRVDEIPALDVVVARASGARAAAGAAARLDGLPAIEYAARDGEARVALEPNDPEYAVLHWPIARTELERAWDVELGDAATTIAIVDTGVNPVADLGGKLLPGHDFANGDADPADDHGHGTSVAGVAAAVANNGVGAAGVCSGCRILPVKVLGADGSGSWAAIAAGIVWAADQGAEIVNASLGGQYGAQVLEDAVRYATDRGALVVLAAGNSGSTDPNACHPTSGQCGGYPAYYATTNPGILSVGATDWNDALYSFSNRGPWVRVAAPGCLHSTTKDGGYATACGTSLAAPVVAGIAGLLESWDPSLTNLQLKSAIEAGADMVAGLDVATGRVDAYAALVAAGYTTAPPASTALPALSGSAEAGATLAATPGAWSGGPATYSYAWQTSATGSSWTAVAGETGSTYVVRAADVGRRVRVLVTASNPFGRVSAASAAAGPVAARTVSPAPAPPPAGGGGGGGGPRDLGVRGELLAGSAVQGASVSLRFTVSGRAGSGLAEGVVLAIDLPATLRLVGAQSNRGAGCAPSTTGVTCHLDTIWPGVEGSVLVSAAVLGSGAVAVTARVTARSQDASPADDATTVHVPASAAPSPSPPAAPPTAPGRPAPVPAPLLAGRAAVGGVLRAAVPPVAGRVAYQWQVRLVAPTRSTSSSGGGRRVVWRWFDLAGEHGAALRLRPRLAGKAVRVVVVARTGTGVVRLASRARTVLGSATRAR